jgi:putative SOS response-associated peptidase YedK
MCGRFTIISDPVAYQIEFDFKMSDESKIAWKARYNVAPSQPIPVVLQDQEHRLDLMQWGLIPNWPSNRNGKINLINVRAETVREKAYFKGLAERKKRCLILADGFYEWQKVQGKDMPKTPYYFQRKDGKPFAFAGLWETSPMPDNRQVNTCAIITCPPNSLVAPVHNRMPVMLEPAAGLEWLEQTDIQRLLALLAPYSAEEMQTFPVSRLVNNPRADDPACILPAEA